MSERDGSNRWSRRSLLRGAIGAAMGGAAAGERLAAGAEATAAPARAPVAFLSHGSPRLPLDPVRSGDIRAWGATLAKPSAIVVMTPHFFSRKLTIGSTGRGAAMYNLPDALRRSLPPGLDYPSPKSDAIASRVEALLAPHEPVARDERPGFDHTTWMPLLYLRPAADAPVVELALPYRRDADLFALGRRLAPLRDEGVLFLASGQMTHNLAAANIDEGAPPAWAREFDAWGAESIASADVDALLDWRTKAPASEIAHPDDGGHFRVLLVALGVAFGAGGARGGVRFPITGFDVTMSKRAVQIG